jgi:hypothetical protein
MKRAFSGALILATSVCSVAATHAEERYQTSNVVDVTGAAASPYVGAAWLIRSENEIEGRIMTKVSTAGDPYTVWIILFNDPASCLDMGCGEDDIVAGRGQASVFYGTSAISAPGGGLDRNGKPSGGGVVNLDFEIEGGDLPNDLFVLVPGEIISVGGPPGLAEGNGFGVEVHLVVDRHPPVPAGMSWIPDLTTTNLPGFGPATNDRAAVFLACPEPSCPATVL